MKITQEQYDKILEIDNLPIDYKAIKEFKEQIKNFDKENIKIYELS